MALRAQGSWVSQRPLTINALRWATTTTDPTSPAKAAGDISSVFPSLSGATSPPLPPRFADLKRRLISGHEDAVEKSWQRLLADLRKETEIIKALGSKVIPELDFRYMHDLEKRTRFRDELHKRGVAIIRGVVSEKEALDWKELVKRYIQTNPSTKGREPLLFQLFLSKFQQISYLLCHYWYPNVCIH